MSVLRVALFAVIFFLLTLGVIAYCTHHDDSDTGPGYEPTTPATQPQDPEPQDPETTLPQTGI